jgi:hypothetical protein
LTEHGGVRHTGSCAFEDEVEVGKRHRETAARVGFEVAALLVLGPLTKYRMSSSRSPTTLAICGRPSERVVESQHVGTPLPPRGSSLSS